jgi:single-strand DNA-binding protein
MANYNKVLLMGNLTRDPELRYLPSNTPVCQIGLAVNRRFRRQDGEQGEETCFIDCEAFARPAEIINQYCRKGRPLFIEGRLRLDQWQDRDGNNRSKLKVVIENFQFIDGGGGGDNAGPEPYGSEQRGGGYGGRSGGGGEGGYVQRSAGGGSGPGAPGPAPEPGPDETDIPF